MLQYVPEGLPWKASLLRAAPVQIFVSFVMQHAFSHLLNILKH